MTSVFRQLADFTKKLLFKTRNGSSANCSITKNKDLTSYKHKAPYFFSLRFSCEQKYMYIQAPSQCCVLHSLESARKYPLHITGQLYALLAGARASI